jgi:hypothetical protein
VICSMFIEEKKERNHPNANSQKYKNRPPSLAHDSDEIQMPFQ